MTDGDLYFVTGSVAQTYMTHTDDTAGFSASGTIDLLRLPSDFSVDQVNVTSLLGMLYAVR